MLNIALVYKYVAHMGHWPSGFSKVNLLNYILTEAVTPHGLRLSWAFSLTLSIVFAVNHSIATYKTNYMNTIHKPHNFGSHGNDSNKDDDALYQYNYVLSSLKAHQRWQNSCS